MLLCFDGEKGPRRDRMCLSFWTGPRGPLYAVGVPYVCVFTAHCTRATQTKIKKVKNWPM